jgi:hypothetical protein
VSPARPPSAPTGATPPVDLDPGVSARDAWSRTPAPVPAIPPPPRVPGRPDIGVTDPSGEHRLRADSLRVLASDAASRAWALASGEVETGLGLSVDQDLARWAAALFESDLAEPDRGPSLTELARTTGTTPRELERRALAWRDGGAGGFAALVDSWDPDPVQLDPGRERLGPSTITRRNRLTRGDEQLRRGRDGYWYPYRKTRNGWDPDGPPFEESELAR